MFVFRIWLKLDTTFMHMPMVIGCGSFVWMVISFFGNIWPFSGYLDLILGAVILHVHMLWCRWILWKSDKVSLQIIVFQDAGYQTDIFHIWWCSFPDDGAYWNTLIARSDWKLSKNVIVLCFWDLLVIVIALNWVNCRSSSFKEEANVVPALNFKSVLYL